MTDEDIQRKIGYILDDMRFIVGQDELVGFLFKGMSDSFSGDIENLSNESDMGSWYSKGVELAGYMRELDTVERIEYQKKIEKILHLKS